MERIDKIRAIIAQIETMKMIGAGRISLEDFRKFMDQKVEEIQDITAEILLENNYIEVSLLNKTLNEYSKTLGLEEIL